MEEKSISAIVDEIKETTAQLKSLFVSLDDEQQRVCVEVVKYRYEKNLATSAQIDYIKGLPNVSRASNSTLYKMNKWCASAIIDMAKKYPNIDFYVSRW